jgi:uncharacterized protein DUF4231
MTVLSRFGGLKRDKIVQPDTKSAARRTFGDRSAGGHVQPDEYIEQRVRQYQNWYDRKAGISKSRYLRMRGASVIGGAVVPALVNYTGLAPADAFKRFIERVEGAIASENSATLNTMTIASEATVAFDAHRNGAGAEDAESGGGRAAAGAASSGKEEDR